MQIIEKSGLRFEPEFLDADYLRTQLTEFLPTYARRPFEDNSGGVAIGGSFGLFQLARKIMPRKIVESGVWKGHTTWVLEQAAPEAQLLCFDPRIANMKECFKYISDKAKYMLEDFGSIKFKELTSGEGVLAFFDDHQDAMERIAVCLARGVKHIVFDDNYFRDEGHRSLFQILRAGGVEAAALRAVAEFVYVMPPVFKWSEDSSDIAPLLQPQQHSEALDPYFKDRGGYRWMTYLRLR